MAEPKRPHVLIAGAGIGGLVLAQCLRRAGHPFTVFERDASTHARHQGWAIALHSILADLVACVPDDMPGIDGVDHLLPLDGPPRMCFYDTTRGDGGGFFVESARAEDVGYGPGRIIRANRDRLREWLLTGIEVRWGMRITGVEQDGDGVTARFADGTSVMGDVLVGADGARSVVRQAILPDVRLENVPACFVTGEVTLGKEEYEEQMRLGRSAYAVLGSGCHVFVGLNRVAGDASSADYYWDLIWHDEARTGPHWIDTASAEDLYDFVLRKTEALDSRLTRIIRLTSPQGVKTPPLILRDLVLEDMPVSRVTLLGDAAHAMVPFKGEGGCHAIDDAIRLSKVLMGEGDMDAYQKEMLARGSAAVRASRMAGDTQARAGNTQTEARVAWGQPVKPI